MELPSPHSLPTVAHPPQMSPGQHIRFAAPGLFLAIILAATNALAQATDISVESATGSIDVRTTRDWSAVSVTAHCFGRECLSDEVRQTQEQGTTVYRAAPADGVRVDLQVTLPYTTTFQASTFGGSISVTGLMLGGVAITRTGEITVAAPLKLTGIEARCNSKPKAVELPKGFQPTEPAGEWKWVLHAAAPVGYGRMVFGGEAPRVLTAKRFCVQTRRLLTWMNRMDRMGNKPRSVRQSCSSCTSMLNFRRSDGPTPVCGALPIASPTWNLGTGKSHLIERGGKRGHPGRGSTDAGPDAQFSGVDRKVPFAFATATNVG
jgi:hypothetical protein